MSPLFLAIGVKRWYTDIRFKNCKGELRVKTIKRCMAALCAAVLLLGCCGVLAPVSAAGGKYGVSFKMFPPEEFGEMLKVPVKAGKSLATKYNGCGVQMSADMDVEYAAIYIRASMGAAMAKALNDGGRVVIGNNMGTSGGTMEWDAGHVTWQEGMNEALFRFSGGYPKNIDFAAVLNWFEITSAAVEEDTSITFYEVSLVDATEGGMEFGKTDTYLQMTAPLAEVPNTLEVSVRVAPTSELSAARYAIFSNRAAEEQQPVSLAMTAAGALVFEWGATTFTVNCDVRVGEWVDIAVVRDMTAKKFCVYLDGVLKGTFDATGTPDIRSAVPYCIAADADGSATFAGGIADIRVWSDARTQKEIQENRISKYGNRKNGIAANAQGLLGNWYIIGTTDFVLGSQADASANGNALIFRGTRAAQWLDYDKTQYDFLYDAEGKENYYSMVVVPDIQNLVNNSYTDEWQEVGQWIADNVERENIVHVMGMGDSSWTTSPTELHNARAGYDRFSHLVSWNNVPGNHDYVWDIEYRNSKNYRTIFSEEYLQSTASKDVYQGYFEDPYGYSTVENSYYCFGVNGVRWMVLQLEFHPRLHVLEWANNLLKEHADYNVIINTHGYLDANGGYTSTHMAYVTDDEQCGGYLGATTVGVWDKLIKENDNVKMVLCGHNRDAEGSVVLRQDTNAAGHTVPAMMFNAQELDVGDTISPSYFEGKPMAMLGILRFSADGTQCAVQYYAPLYDKSYHVRSNSYSFEMHIAQATDCAHTQTKEKLVGVTCQKGGVKKTLCKECGVLLGEETVGPLTTHTWDGGVITKKPTAAEKGEKTFTCTVCQTTRTEELEPTGELGDVDGSGTINSTDARLVLQYAVKKIGAEKLTLPLADVDGNGRVDSTDARLILQYTVKKIAKFPAA